jgi:hypothetical protein
MADTKHVEILAAGVEDWNTWRKKNPGIVPNLISAKLADRDLRGVNFSSTHPSIAERRESDGRGPSVGSASTRPCFDRSDG